MQFKRTVLNFKNLLLLVLFTNTCFAQTVVYSDNMENTGWTWKGVPKVLLNSYYVGGNSLVNDNPSNQPLYTSSDSSFALFGIGTGSSTIEKDTLSYTNITGLDPNMLYQIRFKLASFGINSTINAASGVDGTDYVQLEYSSNSGVSWFKEIKVVGASNSVWRFGSGSQVNKTASGTLTTFIGSTLSPISTVGLNLPVGITQVAVNLLIVANASGESWYIDDIELVTLGTLPIELLYFKAECKKDICLSWSTFSEENNDYFTIYKSFDAIDWDKIGCINGAGNSSQIHNYKFNDNKCSENVVYYKLSQTDYDGRTKEFNPVAIICYKQNKKLLKTINVLGQDVDENYNGPKYYIYEQ